MNPLDTATPEDVRAALVGGEFKRLVKYDSSLGENEKKHILASAERVVQLAERSMQNALYDLPPLPADVTVMAIVSSMFGVVYSYIFADEEHAKASARWYAVYAGWVKPPRAGDKPDKDRGTAIEQEGGETFLLRILDGKSGDYVIVSKARVNLTPIAQTIEVA